MNPLFVMAICSLIEEKCDRLADRVAKKSPCPVRLRQELLLYESALEEFQKFCKEE